ncbi:amino acid ABC transporter ATP-binding protein [Streptococcus pneumoniae]|nr:amino acid ABC transporter ATP-binding protein [Streptococcus pneumoniae]VRF14606.1 amino acid ABC transporter ATP-binding protein [Streptococcus pneumoniae]
MTETLIKIENLHKSFGKNEVLKGINLEIKRGEVVVIIGPSGSGKSTLLRSMNLLEEATKGKVIFEGVDITDKKNDLFAMREKMGMVFQQFNLFPNMTVMENITLSPIKTKGESRKVAEKRAQELLEKVGLPDKADAYPQVCRVGNNNGLPSRVGWLWNQMFCSLTNQLQPWILKW